MKKLESTFINMVVVLVGFTAMAAAMLGSVYELTKTPIENARMAKQQKAISDVVPGFDNNPVDEKTEIKTDEGVVAVFPAKKGGVLIGIAVESFTNKGFSGLVKVMVGLDTTGTIINYAVLEHKETPGLGSKMNDWFRTGKGDIRGKNCNKNKMTVSKDGGDVDAITAATISSRAFLDAVRRSGAAFESYIKSTKEK